MLKSKEKIILKSGMRSYQSIPRKGKSWK